MCLVSQMLSLFINILFSVSIASFPFFPINLMQLSLRVFWPVLASSQVLLWVCGTEEPENHSQSQERSGSLRRAASLPQHCIPGFSILCKYHLHGYHQVILIYVNSSDDSFLLKLTIALVPESCFMTTSITSGSKYAQQLKSSHQSDRLQFTSGHDTYQLCVTNKIFTVICQWKFSKLLA